MNTGMRILGLGAYLPTEVRENSWWPEAIVESWRQHKRDSLLRTIALSENVTDPGHRLVVSALQAHNDDPFEGVQRRHVAPANMSVADMEQKAATEALTRAGVTADQIDFVLEITMVPDRLSIPNACTLHERLGLRRDCFTLTTDAMCNTFAAQMRLAKGLIASGKSKHGLLVQSSTLYELLPQEDPASAWFGAAATAVVVGPCEAGRGLVSDAHRTNGAFDRAMVYGTPGKKWYEEGRTILYTEDRKSAKMMLLSLANLGKEVIDSALGDAGIAAQDVKFLASHQATSWLWDVVRESACLKNSIGTQSFAWTGSLAASNVPFQLALGVKEGLICPGDTVVTFSGGSGMTYASMVFRW